MRIKQNNFINPLTCLLYTSYREIVRVLNIANENHFKMVLATRPPEKKR